MAGRYGLRSKESGSTASPGVFKSPSKILADQLSTISFGGDELSNASDATDKKLRSAFRAGRKSTKENFPAAAFGATPTTRENYDKTPSPPKEEPKAPSSASTRSSSRHRAASMMPLQNVPVKTAADLHTRPEPIEPKATRGRKSASPPPPAPPPPLTKADSKKEPPKFNKEEFATKTPKTLAKEDSITSSARASVTEDSTPAVYQDAMLPSFTSFGRKKTGAGVVKRRAKKLILDAVTKEEGSKDGGDEMAVTGDKENDDKKPAKLPPVDLSWLNVDDLAELIVPELNSRRLVSDQLMRRYRGEFSRWVVQLLSGFNLLFHGLGSKKELLNEFCDQKLLPNGFNVVEVDGWRPDFSFSDFVKELFFNYCRQAEDSKLSDGEMIGRVESYLQSSPSHVVILVHSIDGVEIRGNRKFHSTLSSLAKLPRVHVLASADHVNFPLMWDTATVENFNWIYVETPTFEPPVAESRANECSLLRSILRAHSSTGAHVTLTSVRHVVFSLTPNAIKMFILLCYIYVEKQARRTAAKKAKKGRKKNAEAMEDDAPVNDDENMTSADLLLPLSVLYKHCRDQFIVSSFELMLKHLRELFDHTLAKQVKHPEDGVDCLQMNMTCELASSFLDECKSGEYAQFLDSLSTDIEL